MSSGKKENIPPEVYNKRIVHLNETAVACLESIAVKFNIPHIFNNKSPLLYDSFSKMAPETIEVFNTMRLKCTWLLRHSINVAALSLLITDLLGYSEQEKRIILSGALLHDVGKMVISESILQKPGALTAGEIAVIRRHPLSGYHMIANSDIPSQSKLTVLQHHERLDGSGYPDQLKAQSISDGARIVMVADSLDAMTSYRPYKAAQSMPKALRSIQNDGGKYDQDIISALTQLLPKSPISAGR